MADEIEFKNAPASPAGERHSPFMTIEFHLLVRCAQITLGDNSTPILSVKLWTIRKLGRLRRTPKHAE
ncbi:hypothetical protein HU675_0020140 [Bradyrhizobium septentrionale]|uniref:hypothetical protein n=1 Tax=Bradyrhizobium septentrionale TaxID=1404411 RepID=UPI0015969E79|nr:hypothetical protein [Bradyrhizobium septentrionale]UGY28891.1 hypothetical protein HU675_0020140 [Bradyrhizobium septentrionale]